MRAVYVVGGLVAVALGAVGAFLPLLPTVPFLLFAAFCFARSNPAWERRIVEHPQWGAQVRDWRERRAIGRRAKAAAIAAMAAGVGFTWLTLGMPWVLVSLAVLVVCGGWIVTRAE